MDDILFLASIWVIPVLLAITMHEAAHGWAASKLGDDTALRMGRVTFNPLAHIDLFGTIILPAILISAGGILFGWAKPVPVNFGRLGRPRRDMVLVAAAGPAINIGLAIVSALALHLLPFVGPTFGEWLGRNLINSININLLLAIFNMMPLPPLDGGRVAVGILPRPLAIQLARLERYGLFILIGLIFILPILGRQLGTDLNIFRWLVLGPLEFLRGMLLHGVGLI
ncbi:MAG: site-2 protease family protein [Rhodospirillaceae bacterium]|nr:site-2 protease family protein [Rhodospirillaceae bacterium]MBT5356785.1 site-2 protease family protein [Rhodospirillaceae bacterium]MBT7364414.1 site-2 protease family protein [Rhodospirillaceae bacterium]